MFKESYNSFKNENILYYVIILWPSSRKILPLEMTITQNLEFIIKDKKRVFKGVWITYSPITWRSFVPLTIRRS